MKLIVGLGNPGEAFANSRHNIGFQCISYLARKYGIALKGQTGRATVGRGEIGGVEVILAKPRTYMNMSGVSVALLVRQLGLPLSDLIVIHDDGDLTLGTIRIRERGSSGGHKGVASIIHHLGSKDFLRVRIGIGRPQDDTGQLTPDYVLGDFTSDESPIVEAVKRLVAEAIYCILTEGTAVAMNRYNRRPSSPMDSQDTE